MQDFWIAELNVGYFFGKSYGCHCYFIDSIHNIHRYIAQVAHAVVSCCVDSSVCNL